MKAMKDTSIMKIGTLLFICMIAWTGCDATSTEPELEQAPAVLPEEAFSMDLGMFDQGEDISSKTDQHSSHYIASVWRVSVATLITTSILYYPAVLTAAVQEVEPVVSDGAYIWSIETLVKGERHGVELHARLAGSDIEWRMFVSGVDEESGYYFEDFLLYSVRTGVTSEAGDFQVYYPIEGSSVQVMDGSYAMTTEGGHTLSFSIPEGVEDLGGSSAIYEHVDPLLSLDLTGPEGNNHFIEWNTQTGAGSIQADDYNNGEKGCWDETRANVECEVS